MLWGLGSAELDPAIFKPYCHPRIAANHSPNCYHVHFALSTRSQTAETLMFAGKGFFSSQPSKGIPRPPTSMGWLCDPWTVASRLFCPWDSPGKNTRVGCHFLLQGIFPTQGSYPCLLHWPVSSLPLSHQGKQDLKSASTKARAQGIYRVTNEAWLEGLRYGLPWWLSGKEIRPANARDAGSVPGLGWSPEKGNGNPLQYSCLENPMNRGAWRATSMGSQSVGHELATEHVHMGSLGRLGSLGEGDWKNMHALSFSAGVTEL